MFNSDQLPISEAKRELVSIQIVDRVLPHPNADRLEIVKLLDVLWQAVAQKGQYKPGDPVVMFEPDAVLPDKLAEAVGLPAGVTRIKPMKLRGEASQVYICPISCLFDYDIKIYGCVCLADKLGVTKYVKPIDTSLAGDIDPDNLFSQGLIPKTDEERLQSRPGLLERVCGDGNYYITEKLDGSSMTVASWQGRVRVASRNNFLKDGNNTFSRVAQEHQLFDKGHLFDGLAVQGELVGPKIQGNPLDLKKHQFYVFRVWDIINQKPLNVDGLIDTYRRLGLSRVPDVEWFKFNPTAEDFINLADGLMWGDRPAEGIVVSRLDNTASFKVINSNY